MNILDSIGNTPLIYLERLSKLLGGSLYAKLESRNPGGSLNDRVAKACLDGAMRRGELDRGGSVVEADDGAFGLSLAMCCAARDLHLTLCVPATAGKAYVGLLRAMAVNVLVSPLEEGMAGALKLAEEVHGDIWGSFRPDPRHNPDGPQAHYETTGAELIKDCQAQGLTPDAFVMGVGTGAALSGIGRRLREAFPRIRLAAVQAEKDRSGSGAGMTRFAPALPALPGLPGLTDGPVPLLPASLIDETLKVSGDDAARACNRLLKMEGVGGGMSSGANLHGALLLFRRPEFQGKCVLTLVCDSSERYLGARLIPSCWKDADSFTKR